MPLIKLKNNSSTVRTYPAVGSTHGKAAVPGPKDMIVHRPGEVIVISTERLKLYESPAFNSAFAERHDGRYPDLQVVGRYEGSEAPEQLDPSAPVAELVAQYDATLGKQKINDKSMSNMTEEEQRAAKRLAKEAAKKAKAANAPKIDDLAGNAPAINGDAPAQGTVSTGASSPVDIVG